MKESLKSPGSEHRHSFSKDPFLRCSSFTLQLSLFQIIPLSLFSLYSPSLTALPLCVCLSLLKLNNRKIMKSYLSLRQLFEGINKKKLVNAPPWKIGKWAVRCLEWWSAKKRKTDLTLNANYGHLNNDTIVVVINIYMG